jgi:hypothetical protein
MSLVRAIARSNTKDNECDNDEEEVVEEEEEDELEKEENQEEIIRMCECWAQFLMRLLV